MRQGTRADLQAQWEQTRSRCLALFEHVHGPRLVVPQIEILNPPLWELGHLAWFQEFWILRAGNRAIPSVMAGADDLYDSAGVGHENRWRLPMPPMARTRAYLDQVFERSMQRLGQAPESAEGLYFHRLSAFHEMMHIEAFTYSWQTLAYPQPGVVDAPPRLANAGQWLAGAGGPLELGSRADEGFVFDNEKWAGTVDVEPFSIGAQPVTNAEFATFVQAGGYQDARWWTEGLPAPEAGLPRYWRRAHGGFEARRFERWEPLAGDEAVMNIDAREAEAYCRWAGGGLPTEAQWLWAATHLPAFRWGDAVWEWTATPFGPLEGFSPDPYREYSAPWFGDHRVVRGGSFATPRALVDKRFRNFYKPHRGDPFLGFRLCRPVA